MQETGIKSVGVVVILGSVARKGLMRRALVPSGPLLVPAVWGAGCLPLLFA
jgi:hypothetical protein